MKKTRKTHSLILIPAAALMLAACQKIEMVGTPSQPSGSGTPICFGLGFEPDVVKSAPAAAAPVSSDSFVLRSTDGSSDSLCMQSIETGRSLLTKGSPVGQDNFYTDFYVFSRTTANVLFMEAKATATELTGSNGLKVWETQPTYYWPGSAYTLNFFAGAPAEVFQNGKEGSISYTVPVNVADQQDLMAATALNIAGNSNSTVDLEFKHICTAVSFAFGTEMQPGTIKSIALKGVYGSGSYSFDLTNGGGSWTTSGNPTDFTHTLDKATTGSESEGTAITEAAATFMMIPQPLPDGATVEVVFNSNITGEKTLSASIAGTIWHPDRSITYKLSISPEYEISITPPSEKQDAHYVICSAEIDVSKLPAGKQWTLSASTSDNSSESITFLSELSDYHNKGYWTDRIVSPNGSSYTDLGSARGKTTISGSGSQTVYIFLPENAGDATRTVTLSLKVDDHEITTATFDQLCPDWNDSGFGWEQIENDPLSTFGYKWTRKVTYKRRDYWWNVYVWGPYADNLVSTYDASNYVTVTNTGLFDRTTVAIDYTKLNNLNLNSYSRSDGLSNTMALYSYAGSGATGELEQALSTVMNGEDTAFTIVSQSGENNLSSAALSYVLKKNKYNLYRVETVDNNGNTAVSETPGIPSENIKWYLPAVDQFATTPTGFGLEGTYWSSYPSTGTNSYISNGSDDDRMNEHKIRACRNKQ